MVMACSTFNDQLCFRVGQTSQICNNADASLINSTLTMECSTPVRPNCLYIQSNEAGRCAYRDSIVVGRSVPLEVPCKMTTSGCNMAVDTDPNQTRLTLRCTNSLPQGSVPNDCTRDGIKFEEEMKSETTTDTKCSSARFGIVLDNKWLSGNCNLEMRLRHHSLFTTTTTTTITETQTSTQNTLSNTNTSNGPLMKSTTSGPEDTGSLAGIIVGSILGCVLVVAIIALLIFWFKRKSPSKQTTTNGKTTDAILDYEELKVDEKSESHPYNSLNVSISNICLENPPRENSSMSNFYTIPEGDTTNSDYLEPDQTALQTTCDDQNIYLEVVDSPDMIVNTNLQNLTEEDESDYIVPGHEGTSDGENKEPGENAKGVQSYKL